MGVNMTQSRWIGLLAALCTTAPAAAQPAAPAQWAVDWGDQYCTLSRASMGSVSVLFAIKQVPGSETIELVLAGPGLKEARFGSSEGVNIRFSPAGAELKGLIQAQRSGQGDIVAKVYRLKNDFVDHLAKASELLIVGDGKGRLHLPIPAQSSALAALRTCVDDGMARWGVDPVAAASLRERPSIMNPESVIQPMDYPDEALRRNESGAVVMRLDVSEIGRVSGCTVVATSGSAVLDSATCQLLTRRARYKPATATDGNAAPAKTIVKFNWLIPG
jgi:TonB family protein